MWSRTMQMCSTWPAHQPVPLPGTLVRDAHLANTLAPCTSLLTCSSPKEAFITMCAKPHLPSQSPMGGQLHLGSILPSWITYVFPESRTVFHTQELNRQLLNTKWLNTERPIHTALEPAPGCPQRTSHAQREGETVGTLSVWVSPPYAALLLWTPHKESSSKHLTVPQSVKRKNGGGFFLKRDRKD